jgi:putative ABC transport system permease protein
MSGVQLGMRVGLAAATLRRHPARTLLAALGVAVSAAMLLDMVMLSSGMSASFRSLLEQSGFSIRVTPRGTVPFDSDATIADAAATTAALRRVPGVTTVAPVLGASLHVVHGASTVTAFGLGVDPAVQGDYTIVRGAEASRPDALVVSEALAVRLGAAPGDTLDVAVGYDPQLRVYAGRRRLVISGVAHFRYLAAGQLAGAVRLATLQAMGGDARRDRVSLFMVATVPSANPDSVGAAIDRLVPRVSAISTAEAVRLADQRLSYFRQLAFILGAVSLIVGFLLVTTLMTVSVNERVGEIAVMRAIGISRVHVVQQVVLEGIAITIVGVAAGLGLGLLTARYLNAILSDFPGLPAAIDFFLFQPRDAWTALAMLLASGIVAGAYPSWRASSLPIAATLRREAVG